MWWPAKIGIVRKTIIIPEPTHPRIEALPRAVRAEEGGLPPLAGRFAPALERQPPTSPGGPGSCRKGAEAPAGWRTVAHGQPVCLPPRFGALPGQKMPLITRSWAIHPTGPLSPVSVHHPSAGPPIQADTTAEGAKSIASCDFISDSQPWLPGGAVRASDPGTTGRVGAPRASSLPGA